MNSTPKRPASSSPPRISSAMMVIWLGLIAIWRKISGSTPWPIEPKPTITMRPVNGTYFLKAFFFDFLAMRRPCSLSERSINGDGAFLKAPSRRADVAPALDADRLERLEAVEGHRRVGRRVG